jgi:hypothetical protein
MVKRGFKLNQQCSERQERDEWVRDEQSELRGGTGVKRMSWFPGISRTNKS